MHKLASNIQELRSRIEGKVLTPENEGYDEARQLWDLSTNHKPSIIIKANNTSDIIEAVRFAKNAGLKIAAAATGHGFARPANDSLLIVTSQMAGVSINASSKTAWVEAGAKWNKVLKLAQEEGLAPLMGSSSDVGAIGYTIGGGMGWLSRKYGLSVDSVNYFEVVTASGKLIRASETENSDLFWGISGGGASLGIITGMEINLYPVKSVFAGSLIYPSEVAHEAFARYRKMIASASEEFTSSLTLANLPPLPFLPEFLQGKSVVIFRGCHSGSVEEGEAVIKPWLDWKPPIANSFRVMPFGEADDISQDPKDPMPFFVTNVILKELTEEVSNILIDRAFSSNEPSPLIFAELHHVGGAIAKIPRSANAYSKRDASLILKMIGLSSPPEIKNSLVNLIDMIKNDLKPYLADGVYLNFLIGEEKWLRSREAFSPEAFHKLVELKSKYDPGNLFSFGLDIPISGENGR
jgi:hypothetical protein